MSWHAASARLASGRLRRADVAIGDDQRLLRPMLGDVSRGRTRGRCRLCVLHLPGAQPLQAHRLDDRREQVDIRRDVRAQGPERAVEARQQRVHAAADVEVDVGAARTARLRIERR